MNFSVPTRQFQKNMTSIAEVCRGSFSPEITSVPNATLVSNIKLVFENKMRGTLSVRPWKGNGTVCGLEQ